jgi:hypothetical protein
MGLKKPLLPLLCCSYLPIYALYHLKPMSSHSALKYACKISSHPPLPQVEEYEHKLKELEDICNPIVAQVRTFSQWTMIFI